VNLSELDQRQRYILYLSVCAALIWALVLIGHLFRATPDTAHRLMGQPVFSDMTRQMQSVDAYQIRLADQTYHLKRAGSAWIMPEANNYRVRPDRMSEFEQGLETLSFSDRRTADPARHALIGLGDPGQGGNGVLITALDKEGKALQSAILGWRDEQLYVRRADRDQTYRASGRLPPLFNRQAWLDFDLFRLDGAAISSVRLSDAQGGMLYFSRSTGQTGQGFRPAPPNQTAQIRNRLAVASAGLALTRFAPLDAKPVEDLLTQPVAQHVTETFDGLEIILQAYSEADGQWVTLRAVEAGEGARRARSINSRSQGWAYRLSAYDFRDFTPELSDLVTWPEQMAQP